MKAVRMHAFGRVDALSYEDVPRPIPGGSRKCRRLLRATGASPGADVIATAFASRADYVRSVGRQRGYRSAYWLGAQFAQSIDAVIDTVGGDALVQSLDLLRSGGVLVSAVAEPDQHLAKQRGVRATFMLASVATAGLVEFGELIEASKLRTNIGEILPLSDARAAHEMLAGREHRPGKIVLLPTQAD